MFNIALALAFALSSLLSLGKQILHLVIEEPVLQSLPHYQGHLLLAFTNYWVPAVLIYVLLRLLRADAWLRPRPAIHVLLGLANCLLIIYIAVRAFASTIQGGGASFAVMSYAPLVVLPAWAMLTAGLTWLTVRCIRNRKEPKQSKPRSLGTGGVLMITALFGIPLTAIVSTLYFAEHAPFRLAREAKQLFDEKCKSSSENIAATPQNVESIYLEPNGQRYFKKIINGIYGAYGSSRLGEEFVYKEMLLYFEQQNDRQSIDGSTEKYRKYDIRNQQGEPVAELTSNYGVFQKSLISVDEEKRLGVSGTEVTVKNLKTDQITATLVFFTSSRHRAICGPVNDGNLNIVDFIKKSLNLTQRFQEPTGLKQP